MRIKLYSGDDFMPRFVVEADTIEDKMLLRVFAHRIGDPKWEVRLGGATYADGEVISFNFGWIGREG